LSPDPETDCPSDDLSDLGCQLRFDQHFLGILNSEVRVNVRTAFFDLRHFSTPSACCLANFSRVSTMSISCFGVEMPLCDFFGSNAMAACSSGDHTQTGIPSRVHSHVPLSAAGIRVIAE